MAERLAINYALGQFRPAAGGVPFHPPVGHLIDKIDQFTADRQGKSN